MFSRLVQRMQAYSRVVMGIITLLTLVFSVWGTDNIALAQARSSTTQKGGSTCLQPPANIDLSMLSDTQLDLYGLPRHPTESARISQWQKVLQHTKHRFCDTRPRTVRSSGSNSLNWAGNEAIGGGYTEANANWTIPFYNNGSKVWPNLSVHWVGLGGDGSHGGGYLEQVGTGTGIDAGGNSYYYAWLEIYPGPINQYATFGVNPGDLMYGEVDIRQNGSQAYLFINDVTLNAYTPLTYSTASNGSTAEWIAERPTDCSLGQYTRLADFSYVDFTTAQAVQNGSQLFVGETNHIYYVMRDANNTELANPGPINNLAEFKVYWDNEGVPSSSSC
jgi:hypothetical protein